MDITTMTMPAAALPSRSESPFVMPAGVAGYWHLGTAGFGNGLRSTVVGGMAALGLDVPTRTPALDEPSVSRLASTTSVITRNARTTAKQAAPPRGEPR